MHIITGLVALGLIEDIVFWAGMLWWLWLAILAWYFYNWAQEHLAFSPILSTVVAFILIYYLVFEHPIAGSMMFIVSILLFSGLVYMLPYIFMFLPFRKK